MIKKLLSICVVLLFLTVCVESVVSLKVSNNKNDEDEIFITSLGEPVQLPTWEVNDHFWKYDMDFVFENNGIIPFSVDATIANMKAKVSDIENIGSKEYYKLTLSGSISGKVSLGDLLSLAQLRGDFSGSAYISVDELAIKKFIFNVDGEVKYAVRWKELVFNMEMGFSPQFDFLDFPINQNEGPWFVNINQATIAADVYVGVGLGINYDFSDSMVFDDELRIKDIEPVDIPNEGVFNSYRIGGTWGNPSNLWYTPELGYLSKVREKIDFGSINAEMNLDLIETSYNDNTQENRPPNEPTSPYPAHNANDVNINVNLHWLGGDPDGDDIVSYDVYFGTDSTPDSGELISEKQTELSFDLEELQKDKTYYWKIVAFDNNGESTTGDVWKFKTAKEEQDNNPPTRPIITGPDVVKVFEENLFTVSSTDPDGDYIIYLVYLFRNGQLTGGEAFARPSGVDLQFLLKLPFEGDWEMRIRATDNISGWSDWGSTSVTCPKAKVMNIFFTWFANRYFNRWLI